MKEIQYDERGFRITSTGRRGKHQNGTWYDEEGDDFHAFPIERYVMETGKVTMDDGI